MIQILRKLIIIWVNYKKNKKGSPFIKQCVKSYATYTLYFQNSLLYSNYIFLPVSHSVDFSCYACLVSSALF